MTKPEDRLIAGEIHGEESRELFGELKTRPWRFGVRVAVAMLHAGMPDQALATLQELIDNTEDGKELLKFDAYDYLSALWRDKESESRIKDD